MKQTRPCSMIKVWKVLIMTTTKYHHAHLSQIKCILRGSFIRLAPVTKFAINFKRFQIQNSQVILCWMFIMLSFAPNRVKRRQNFDWNICLYVQLVSFEEEIQKLDIFLATSWSTIFIVLSFDNPFLQWNYYQSSQKKNARKIVKTFDFFFFMLQEQNWVVRLHILRYFYPGVVLFSNIHFAMKLVFISFFMEIKWS